MNHIGEKLIHYIMSISFQERKKKALEKYRKEVNRLEDIADDEVDFEYINLKSKYEHKKNILFIFILTIIICILMNVWKYFFNIIEKIIQLTVNQGIEIAIAKVLFIGTITIIVFITILTFFVIQSYVKQMHEIYMELLIVEEIKKKQNK
ncbi:MAG: hypothetical protein KHZ94_07310 [Anaerostipes sp.]|uniref:hypothetical protein n=1 Tax=Anaerostipes sp. TaxID=1872530 RepID=UPI00257E79A5|nr:hypothetical protein [Anaerostipes sp.]MBS4928194.1 hypothetical protein [Anaerostipes sp.]